MKVLAQRVTDCSVTVDNKEISKIEKGLLVYFGVKVGDTEKEVDYMVKKVVGLRVFEDENGKMNLSVKDIGGQIMVVSQFTLYGDVTNGFRPSYIESARPETAKPLYESFIKKIQQQNIQTGEGQFGADMKVKYINDGPCSIIITKENDI